MGKLQAVVPQRVYAQATMLLDRKMLSAPPPWYQTIGSTPPSERMVRPAFQHRQKKALQERPSKMFQPLQITYEEDNLRWEYFNDHPWELARPRVVLENDGRDQEKWDWSLELNISLKRPWIGQPDEKNRTAAQWDRMMKSQSGRPVNGESVVQRQQWLLDNNKDMSAEQAYDIARKEYYGTRHFREIETRVAKEEALAYGAVFGRGPVEVGMLMEDKTYDAWKTWAEKEVQATQQLRASAYDSGDSEDGLDAPDAALGSQEDLNEVSGSIPGSQSGQKALGGSPIRP